MSEHRWALVVVTRLTDRLAAKLTTLDYHERLDLLDDLRTDGAPSKQPSAMRGPVCLECRVDYETVHRDPAKPWPCPGKRPAALGGSLFDQATTPKLTRPQRRQMQRKAVDQSKRAEREQVRARVSLAVANTKRTDED